MFLAITLESTGMLCCALALCRLVVSDAVPAKAKNNIITSTATPKIPSVASDKINWLMMFGLSDLIVNIAETPRLWADAGNAELFPRHFCKREPGGKRFTLAKRFL